VLFVPSEFDDILYRAKERREGCRKLDGDRFSGFDASYSIKAGNDTLATLPAFGIVDAVERYKQQQSSSSAAATVSKEEAGKWNCRKPNRRECDLEKFSVVFMAYNPDRLETAFAQIQKMLQDDDWKTIVEEVVLVWNGERRVDESETGKRMLEYEKESNFRFAYPLEMGFPNDLLNRYHPDVVKPRTDCILYYDDDGPFYSFEAVRGGFELWKRHATAQVGAMARQISYGTRQAKEREELSDQPNDRLFVSHCDNLNDQVDYNFRYFANYDANMVLPSGSFLHSNYLCYIWHPVLEEIRTFVQKHPVHPDDMTVSLVVSQIAGRAPRVYSRRLNPDNANKQKKAEQRGMRRLLEGGGGEGGGGWGNPDDVDALEVAEETDADLFPYRVRQEQYEHRRLMFSIDWDANGKMNDAKKMWAALRTEAINSLVRYFGSINSGSIGWCEGTRYYNPKKDGRCDPVMAKQGWLPWMNPDGSPKESCP